ncbi:MAG: protein kinase [Archangium sp.]|nr:protein kinase [Archangium sp.]
MSEFAPGQVFADKFRIIRPLGAGGIGSVYEVEHLFTRHKRALKVLHPELRHDPETVKRFLREAMAAGVIQSEHIVQSLDAGMHGDIPWLLMEMLDGQSLGACLRFTPRLRVPDAIHLCIELTGILGKTHAVGVVHRDLKPENVFVLDTTDTLFLKVLDFGLSRFSPSLGVSGLTAPGSRMGTPLYMAPEQMMGKDSSSPALDLFAVGVMLYETLAGGVPYAGQTWNELMLQKSNEAFAPLRQVRPEVPAELERLTQRLLSVNPTWRPSADETRAELQSLLEKDRRTRWWLGEQSEVTETAGQALAAADTVTPPLRSPTSSPQGALLAKTDPPSISEDRPWLDRLKPFSKLSLVENVFWVAVFAAVLGLGVFMIWWIE